MVFELRYSPVARGQVKRSFIMVRRNEAIDPGSWDNSTSIPVQAWQPCAETHESQAPWNLILCEDLDDLPIIAHCAACGAILGSVCSEADSGFEVFPFN